MTRKAAAVRFVWVAAAAAVGLWVWLGRQPAPPADPAAAGEAVERLWRERRSDVVVEVSGRVVRALADDLAGSRHQRFIVELTGGRTLLVSHNIDLAPRVPVAVGDAVEVRGEYEWNERGGLLHWTHHDPGGRRPGGWIRHRGQEYR